MSKEKRVCCRCGSVKTYTDRKKHEDWYLNLPTGVGNNSATGNIYVGNQGTNYVSILSGSTNRVIGNVQIGVKP
ncbi:MAG TPA: hypothetical protein VEH06_16540 [Candidatus Bathyarchaeia archaeon]|nr:hypothetical protein [Candidatus Bathyarchaeia archaeon]